MSFVVNLYYYCINRYRFTAIAVDPQVKSVNGSAYDVLFIGTGGTRTLFLNIC